MNFNSCPSDPGEKEHRKYIFSFFFVRLARNRERERERAKDDVSLKTRVLRPMTLTVLDRQARSRSTSLVHSCTLSIIKIHIRTFADIQCKFRVSRFIRPRAFIETRVFIDTNGIVEANWIFVSLAKARIDRFVPCSVDLFILIMAIARGISDATRETKDFKTE